MGNAREEESREFEVFSIIISEIPLQSQEQWQLLALLESLRRLLKSKMQLQMLQLRTRCSFRDSKQIRIDLVKRRTVLCLSTFKYENSCSNFDSYWTGSEINFRGFIIIIIIFLAIIDGDSTVIIIIITSTDCSE